MDVIFASVVVLFHDDPMACRVTAAVQAAKQQQGAVACTALHCVRSLGGHLWLAEAALTAGLVV